MQATHLEITGNENGFRKPENRLAKLLRGTEAPAADVMTGGAHKVHETPVLFATTFVSVPLRLPPEAYAR
jgi:hypothetical protein